MYDFVLSEDCCCITTVVELLLVLLVTISQLTNVILLHIRSIYIYIIFVVVFRCVLLLSTRTQVAPSYGRFSPSHGRSAGQQKQRELSLQE